MGICSVSSGPDLSVDAPEVDVKKAMEEVKTLMEELKADADKRLAVFATLISLYVRSLTDFVQSGNEVPIQIDCIE
jgi:hypothetical protein